MLLCTIILIHLHLKPQFVLKNADLKEAQL